MQHSNIKKSTIKSGLSLSNFTTWKVGGKAEWIVEPNNTKELQDLISWANTKKLKIQVIGAGSNLLINDDDELKGLTICMRKMHGYEIDKESGIIEAFSGEPIPNLARKAAKDGLHGLEWAVGIPGTIGGASVMNAGAQNGCIADQVISVKVISTETGKIYEINHKKLDYSYRKSFLQEQKLIVYSVKLRLESGYDNNELIKITNKNLNHRLKTQPYHLPSCGSVFRNPKDQTAGQIIEKLGLKGFRKGNAEISTMHANFIVNKGGAKASDILLLISIIQKKVQKKHGILLHPEVKCLGWDQIL